MEKNKKSFKLFWIIILLLFMILIVIIAALNYKKIPLDFIYVKTPGYELETKSDIEKPIHTAPTRQRITIESSYDKDEVGKLKNHINLIKNISNLRINFLQKKKIDDDLEFLLEYDKELRIAIKEYSNQYFKNDILDTEVCFKYKILNNIAKHFFTVTRKNNYIADTELYNKLLNKIAILYDKILSEDFMNNNKEKQ